MPERFLGSVIVLFASVTLTACSSSSDSPGSNANTSSLIADLCKKLGAAACGSPEIEQQCLSELAQDRTDAENEGCQSELNAYLTCANAGPIECSAIEGSPLRPGVAADCSEKSGAFHECVTGVGPECGVSSGPGPNSVFCGVNCADFSSMCQGASQNGPLDCVCQTGPNAGKTFTAADCSRGMIMATGHECR